MTYWWFNWCFACNCGPNANPSCCYNWWLICCHCCYYDKTAAATVGPTLLPVF